MGGVAFEQASYAAQSLAAGTLQAPDASQVEKHCSAAWTEQSVSNRAKVARHYAAAVSVPASGAAGAPPSGDEAAGAPHASDGVTETSQLQN